MHQFLTYRRLPCRTAPQRRQQEGRLAASSPRRPQHAAGSLWPRLPRHLAASALEVQLPPMLACALLCAPDVLEACMPASMGCEIQFSTPTSSHQAGSEVDYGCGACCCTHLHSTFSALFICSLRSFQASSSTNILLAPGICLSWLRQ